MCNKLVCSISRQESVCAVVRRIEALQASGQPYVVLFDADVSPDQPFTRTLFDALKTTGAVPRYAISSPGALPEG